MFSLSIFILSFYGKFSFPETLPYLISGSKKRRRSCVSYCLIMWQFPPGDRWIESEKTFLIFFWRPMNGLHGNRLPSPKLVFTSTTRPFVKSLWVTLLLGLFGDFSLHSHLVKALISLDFSLHTHLSPHLSGLVFEKSNHLLVLRDTHSDTHPTRNAFECPLPLIGYSSTEIVQPYIVKVHRGGEAVRFRYASAVGVTRHDRQDKHLNGRQVLWLDFCLHWFHRGLGLQGSPTAVEFFLAPNR